MIRAPHSRQPRLCALLVASALLASALVATFPGRAQAGFPADGRFKMQPAAADTWFYYDNVHWYLKAPDKWQHMMGSYASTKLLSSALGDNLSAATAVLLGGVLKELDDALREGWSIKDLIMDAVGVSAAVLDRPGVRVIGYYDSDRFLITVNFAM
jgi:hypothetical protein